MKGRPPTWTADQDEQLRCLWFGGFSAREIGAEIGVTRCAVLGRLHRLGLSGNRKLNPEAAQRKATEVLRKQIIRGYWKTRLGAVS